MSSRSTLSYLQDILKSSDAILSFLMHVTYATYQADFKTKSAVERQLQSLTGAAFRLGADAEKLCPEVDWRAVRGPGNVLRHDYDEIQDDVIWQAIHERLPQLRHSVQNAFTNLTASNRHRP